AFGFQAKHPLFQTINGFAFGFSAKQPFFQTNPGYSPHCSTSQIITNSITYTNPQIYTPHLPQNIKHPYRHKKPAVPPSQDHRPSFQPLSLTALVSLHFISHQQPATTSHTHSRMEPCLTSDIRRNPRRIPISLCDDQLTIRFCSRLIPVIIYHHHLNHSTFRPNALRNRPIPNVMPISRLTHRQLDTIIGL